MAVHITMSKDGGSVSISERETKTNFYIDHRVGSDTKGIVFTNLDKYLLVSKQDAKEVSREMRNYYDGWIETQPQNKMRVVYHANIKEIIEDAINILENHYDEYYSAREKEFNQRRAFRALAKD